MADRPDWKTMPADTREAMLRELTAKGLSSTKIAEHFENCSRNSVIGKLNRIEASSGKPMKRNGRHTGRPKAASNPRPTQKAVAAVHGQARRLSAQPAPDFGTKAIAKSDTYLPLPGVAPIKIIDLPLMHRCRWPVDVPESEFHFACGASTMSDKHVYCASHNRLSVMSSARQTQGAE